MKLTRLFSAESDEEEMEAADITPQPKKKRKSSEALDFSGSLGSYLIDGVKNETFRWKTCFIDPCSSFQVPNRRRRRRKMQPCLLLLKRLVWLHWRDSY